MYDVVVRGRVINVIWHIYAVRARSSEQTVSRALIASGMFT